MKVGILAIQGDFDAHRLVLEKLGVEVVPVRTAAELQGLDGLIIPGGESSTMLKLLEAGNFTDILREFVQSKPSFGTCAGAILLAKHVTNPSQKSLGALDVDISRNAYGRQKDSFIRGAETELGFLEMVFIRAPRIDRLGKGVEVLVKDGADPVLVRQGNILAATFHPELSGSTRVHEEFLKIISGA